MAKSDWKRQGSPIGRKGPRKANPKYKQRSGEPWENREIKELRSLVRQKHADRRDQPETAAARGRDTQQSPA
ncbi:MAG: hypothetical protein RO009_17885 [Pseudorhodoplanes sp.]|jgi:hypothetical protein|nr:hypothetical protein [Pseudorhodoplanes sp.]